MARRVWLAKKTCNENIGRSADPFSQAALLFFEREFGNRILTAEKVQILRTQLPNMYIHVFGRVSTRNATS